MRKPIQSPRWVFAAFLAPAALCLAPLPAVGQAAPSTRPPTILLTPTTPQDRLETRPPDCLDCRPATAPRPSVITNPSWVRTPQPEYPAAAIAAKVTDGRVAVTCIVTPAGVLSDCSVAEESPEGFGFGAAALAGTARARISPRTVNGAAVNARVHFTIRFRLPVEAPPPVPAR